jgi:hypothetical protein
MVSFLVQVFLCLQLLATTKQRLVQMYNILLLAYTVLPTSDYYDCAKHQNRNSWNIPTNQQHNMAQTPEHKSKFPNISIPSELI